MHGDDADRRAAHRERQVHRRGDPEPARDALVDLGVVHDGVDPLGVAALEHAADLGRAPIELHADQVVAPRRRDDRERPLTVGQCDQHEPRPDELPHPSRDEIEQRLELHLRREGGADLAEAFELAEPPRRRLVQARVLDRDRRLRRQQLRELLVLCREVEAPGLLREVEVAVGDPAQHDRDAQERPHRWMVPGKPDRARIVGDVVQPERPRLADEDAQQAASSRQVADRSVRLLVDARGEEPLEPSSGRVDHPERGISRLGQPGRGLDDPLEQRVERQLGVERDPGVDQPAQLVRLRGLRRLVRDARLLHGAVLPVRPAPWIAAGRARPTAPSSCRTRTTSCPSGRPVARPAPGRTQRPGALDG